MGEEGKILETENIIHRALVVVRLRRIG